jgi:hypothetical protein
MGRQKYAAKIRTQNCQQSNWVASVYLTAVHNGIFTILGDMVGWKLGLRGDIRAKAEAMGRRKKVVRISAVRKRIFHNATSVVQCGF